MRRVFRWRVAARAGAAALGVVLSAVTASAAVGGINAGRGGGGVRGAVNDPNAPYVGSGSGSTPAPPGSAMIDGTVRRVDGTPAGDVEVRFERLVDRRVVGVETTRTKEDGAYSIKLADGTWAGMACGSTLGYRPTLWRLTVADGRVLRFREVGRAAPSIAKAEIAVSSDKGVVRTGDEVTLTGAGFRCSGHVVVEVDGMEPVTQTAFTEQRGDRVVFRFPQMRPSTGALVIVRRARFTYVQGPNRSNVARYRAPATALDLDTLPTPSIGPQGGGGQPASPPASAAGKKSPLQIQRFRK